MWSDTALTRRLGIRHPIVQAPMAGGPTTAELVAAVCNAGALGSLGAAQLPPDRITAAVAEIRARTDRPFNVNLFAIDPPEPDEGTVQTALAALAPIREELGLPAPALPPRFAQSFAAQAAAAIAARPAVLSFTFGIPPADLIAEAKAAGILIIGTATTVAEGRAWAAAGADMICVQGAEAGGHRGTFLGDFDRSMIGTMALVPQMADALDLPVIAAGGIMDGRGIAAALALGAAGAQLGTAFLGCPEAGVGPAWRARLRQATDDGTITTRAFTGRPARGVVNRFIREVDQDRAAPFPVQGTLTLSIRRAAAKTDNPEFMALWAGQGAGMVRDLPAAELVEALARETERSLRTTLRD